MNLAAMFTQALERAGVPILGVSFPRLDDRSTWIIRYAPEATREQMTTGEALKGTYDPTRDTAFFEDRALEALETHKLLVAVGLALLTRVLGHPPTPEEQAALFAECKAIYKTL